MNNDDSQFAWWSRLRHSGLLLSPVVQIEKYAEEPEELKWYQPDKLRTAYTRFAASIDRSKDRPQVAQGDILTWVDAVLENYIGHTDQRLARSHSIPESLTAVFRVGSRTETLKPDRVLFAEDGKTPLLLVKADTSPHIGRGKGRTEYAKFLELLRGSGHRIGLLTNGLQFRLVYAGLDFESWCEWESERWFEDSEGTEELLGLRQLLFPTQAKNNKGEVIGAGLPGLLHAVEESRKRQADLSQVLRENVRQAVELLLEDVSSASRTDPELFHALMSPESSDKQLTDAEAHEALMQSTVRVVMRMVVCLFAESRGLLPVNDLIYSQAYGVRTLYELLDETTRHEGSQLGLMSRQSAWPRLMALFRLIHGGSAHGGFTLRPYGGALFRPGDADNLDAVSRALFILEHKVAVNDSTIYRVLKKLLRGPLPVLRGKTKTYVEGPVDYTELRTEFIGLIYEGLLDYRVKRTTDEIGPQVFLNLGRNPVLPLSRLELMLEDDPKSLEELFTNLKKESVTSTVESDDKSDDSEDGTAETEDDQEEAGELSIEADSDTDEELDQTYLDAVHAARRWARQAITATKFVSQQRARETDTEYDKRIEDAIDDLIDRVVAPGEFYLVRAGNTRKGTGTFYTRPQLAVPTVHRTLEPLCFIKDEKGVLIPKTPDEILDLKVCDPACGSASFLVAALHYLTDALYGSLCHHCGLDDPKQAASITLPFGTPVTGKDSDNTVPLPPDDPNRGEEFAERVQALLRRHVVERCIFGVDINPLAIEFARVSLWVETLDSELPFSFLDHKIKVGNALVGCWLNQFEHYPIRAWERNGGDDPDSKTNGVRTERIDSHLKGQQEERKTKTGKTQRRRSGDGIIKQQMREAITDRRIAESSLFIDLGTNLDTTLQDARNEYEQLHNIPINADPDQRERLYRERIEASPSLQRLKHAMDEWCSIWFWPAQEAVLSAVPTPLTFHDDNDAKSSVVRSLSNELKFFHWELEFPDVFGAERQGFDAVIGNPPWEVMKPNSMEFFAEFEPLYRTLEKQAALARQKELFGEIDYLKADWDDYNGIFKAMSNFVKNSSSPFDLTLARGNADKELHRSWTQQRSRSRCFASPDFPFRHQGSADLNSYKLFLESAYHLLADSGRMGFIVPSGIYTDLGCKELRDLFLTKAKWEWLFGFINWELIFNIYYRFKFAALLVEKTLPSQSQVISTAFGRHHVIDWEQAETISFPLPRNNILEFSPKSLSVLEIANERDLDIFRTMYEHSIRIGDKATGWNFEYACEFHMTNDSKHFKPREWWESKGFRPDVFGRRVSDNGEVALPLFEGRMIGQFDFSQKGYVSGRGRSAVWSEIEFDKKSIEPQFLVAKAIVDQWPKSRSSAKLAFMDVASSTNARSFIGSYLKTFPANHKTPVLTVNAGSVDATLLAAAVLNSFSFDYALRARLGGLSLGWFILEECPFPRTIPDSIRHSLLLNVMRVNLIHRMFAPEWLLLREQNIVGGEQEWKRLWAVTVSDRLRLRVETDATVANLFGLEAVDYEWMLRDDPSNPIGFHRVDKALPFKERLTGLATQAFRALKEGKWSAESVTKLSNDEFFEILGIPELTNAEAAKAKGLSGPLILKRKGCHSWHPENFPADDPRHGWTWDDCRKDAIALLGSEEAVEEYIAKATRDGSEDEEDEEPFQLISKPAEKKIPQRTLDFGD